MINAKLNFIDDLNNLDLDQDVISRLSLHLERTYKGSDEVFITPLAKEHTPEFIIEEWDKVFNANMHKLNSTLIELEDSNKAKVGPRSIAVPWSERLESLDTSFESVDYDIKDQVNNLIGQRRLRPISAESALRLLKNNTNSGLPYYTSKGKIKERVLDKYDILLKRQDPCILFTRTQERRKTRNVWGFPVADTLNEMRYYSPLLAYQKGLRYRTALISPDAVCSELTKLITKSVNFGMKLLSIDFTAYDTSVKSQLQKKAFNYIKSLYQINCESELQYIAERFNNIGILTPSGVISGPHGVPSGSTFTNEVDSIVQAAVSMSQPYVTEDSFQVQGDDGVYLLPIDKVNELKSKFVSCGLNVNEDKSYVSDNFAIYLQNLYHIDYLKDGIIGGIYPVYRALNRLLYQERWSNFEDFGIVGKDYYSIRTICIVENCKHHPLFEELVKFVYKYDKYSLNVSDQGVSKYIQMFTQTNGAGGVLNNQYSDNVAGIRSFETFKMIKNLG